MPNAISSSSGNILPTPKIVDHGDKVKGKSVKQKEKTQISCLGAAWQAIKNFFASLFSCCCCCCKKTKRVEISSSDYLPSSLGPKVKKISIPDPKPPAPQPQPTSPPVIPASTVPPKPSPTPTPTIQPAPQPPPKSTYQPLSALQDERQKLSIAPSMSNTPPLLSKPDKFPFFEEMQQAIPEPKMTLSEIKFLELTDTYFKGILNGHLPSISQEKKEGISHPSHLQAVFDFCTGRIDAFMGKKEISEDSKAKAFLAKFSAVKDTCEIWNRLWEVAQKPYLAQKDYETLKMCLTALPNINDEVYQTFPILKTRLQSLSEEHLSKKLLTTAEVSMDKEISSLFKAKLEVNFEPKRAQSLFNEQYVTFLDALLRNILKLFQDQEKQEATLHHIDEILDYYVEEITRINQTFTDFVKQNPDLQLAFTPIDSQSVKKQVQPVIEIWKTMRELQSDAWFDATKVDRKIMLAAKCARELPEANASVWLAHPALKDSLIPVYSALFSGKFSKYIFDQGPDVDNEKKYYDDLERQKKMEDASLMMSQKLGCKKIEREKPKMYTKNDWQKAQDVLKKEQAQQSARDEQYVRFLQTYPEFINP